MQTVGGDHHQELWVPAEQLQEFNAQIVGAIRMEKAFFGENYRTVARLEPLLAGLK